MQAIHTCERIILLLNVSSLNSDVARLSKVVRENSWISHINLMMQTFSFVNIAFLVFWLVHSTPGLVITSYSESPYIEIHCTNCCRAEEISKHPNVQYSMEFDDKNNYSNCTCQRQNWLRPTRGYALCRLFTIS